ncbi:MAG: hypothetical protein EHM49_03375 [Deltaproteobacteria bacterium]|nr:MAG: hypothetical protein EHM49_03375 [Deltaproteobacteria bacterium]
MPRSLKPFLILKYMNTFGFALPRMHPILYAAKDAESQRSGGTSFVPAITEQKITSADDAIAIVCGPPIMIKFAQPVLEKVKFPPERINFLFPISQIEIFSKGVHKTDSFNDGSNIEIFT